MQKAELAGGRGWLAPAAAASLHRIDRQLGRPADINEAGRSAEQADKNYAAWLAYLAGGPKAPYALPASKSVHCQGMAADSDDWYDSRAAAVWRENGWRQTALYPKDPKKNEPWHGEYSPNLDLHRNDPNPTTESEEDDVSTIIIKPLPLIFQVDPGGDWVVADMDDQTYFKVRNNTQRDFYINTARAEKVNGKQPSAVIAGFEETHA